MGRIWSKLMRMSIASIFDWLCIKARAFFVLPALVIIVSLPGVFIMPTLDRDEARFSQASKQMLETGDYIKIRYQDGARHKKPVGIHWMQAASTAMVSDATAKQIWSYRLPSLLGAIMAVCAAFWTGVALFGRREAFIGASLLAVSLLFSSEAHIAKTDAMLCAFTTFAIGALAHMRVNEGRARKRYALCFWIMIGLGVLIKGPVTPMVAGLCWLALVIWEKRISWSVPLLQFTGPILAALIILPWFIGIQWATEGAFFRESIGVDLGPKLIGEAEGHGGPFGYHLAHIPIMLFPATLFLIPAISLMIQTLRKPDQFRVHSDGVVQGVSDTSKPVSPISALRFIICWALPTWLVFELLPTKLPHYILPAYPALCLLCGWVVMQMFRGGKVRFSLWVSAFLYLLGMIILLLMMSPLGVGVLMQEAAGDFGTHSKDALIYWGDGFATFWPVIAFAFFGLVATILLLNRYIYYAVGLAIITGAALGLYIRADFLPNQHWVQPTVQARMALRDVCTQITESENIVREAVDMDTLGDCPIVMSPLQVIDYAEPSLVFEVGTDTLLPPQSHIHLPASDPKLRRWLVWLINLNGPRGQTAEAELMAKAAMHCRKVYKSDITYALNYSNGEASRFMAIAVAPGYCMANN